MKVGCLAAIAIAIALATASTASAQVPIEVTAANTAVTQNFNTLPASGNSNSALPGGVGFIEAGGGSNSVYAADNGSLPIANTYSYGSAGSADRAFGELTDPTVQSTLGFVIHNATGAPITTLIVGYSGEEWRLGDATAPADRLDFQYSSSATSLDAGAWVDVDALDFTTPNEVTTGVKNGNSASNRTVFSPVLIVPPSGVANGAYFSLRWRPVDIIGQADDGLAIDDLSLTTVQSDGDHDGRPDGADNCPAAGNQDQADTDGDGQGDACDSDDDGDGAPDATDNCPGANPSQSDIDGDGQGDACDLDDDADGLVDASDQCPAVAGPAENNGCPATGQPPADGGGVADGDGDGVVDSSDQCPVVAGPVANIGCPATSQPPDDSACVAAKAALAKAKAKLKKLRQKEASKGAIARAKKKVKKAKAAVAAACAG